MRRKKEKCTDSGTTTDAWSKNENIYFIGGTMGVGKTTVSNILKEKLPNAVFLDGDWCWDSDPFTVNEETKEMVIKNID